jgi:hypothetical protein
VHSALLSTFNEYPKIYHQGGLRLVLFPAAELNPYTTLAAQHHGLERQVRLGWGGELGGSNCLIAELPALPASTMVDAPHRGAGTRRR